MYYVYILLCKDLKSKKQYFYTGFTDNLKRRIYQHKKGNSETTKSFDKVELIYYEACLNKTDGRKRELQLKTGFGRGYINRRLENYLKNADMV